MLTTLASEASRGFIITEVIECGDLYCYYSIAIV